MELKDIVSIGGIGGLHKIVGQRPTGLIVETIDKDAKRFPTNLTQKVSILEDISIYTIDGEASLSEVLLLIHKQDQEEPAPNKKDPEDTIRGYMEKVLPNYDKERVYISDLKKLFHWYHILKDELDWKSLEPETDEKEESKDEKKTAAKKTSASKSTKAKPKADAKGKAKPKSANVKSKTSTPRKTGGA